MTTSKVEINSNQAQPTDKEQVDALKKEGVNVDTMQDADGNRVEVSTPDTQPQNLENQRPEWLPEKFKTPQELSKAYTELEKQFSTRQTEEPVKEEAKDLSIPKEEASDGFSVDKYAEEYLKNAEKCGDSPEYPFDVQNVREFAIFCNESGGFTIC